MRIRLVGLLAASLLGAWSAQAETPAQELIQLGKQVEKRVMKLRGLKELKPIQWKLTTKSEVRAYLLKMLNEQYKPGEFENEADAMKALGFIPPDMDFRSFMVSLYEEQAGGYYDPQKEVFYLADWVSPALQEAIISHELTHALQDQHFGIDKFIQRIKGNSDTMYAWMALVEGEATLVMLDDATRKTGIEVDFGMIDIDGPLSQLLMAFSQSQMPQYAKSPKAIREIMMFPYLKGLKFVSHGRKLGGWERIDKIYKDLPLSTEQILHPRKYFTHRDPPTLVSLDFLDPAVPEPWKKIHEDTLGEFMTLQLLDCLGDQQEKEQASAGWDGDKVFVYKRGDRLAWVQLSAWDSQQDAVEYAGAFAKTVGCRKTGYSQQPLSQELKITWRNDQGQTLLVERKGVRVLIVEDFDKHITNQIRRAVFR